NRGGTGVAPAGHHPVRRRLGGARPQRPGFRLGPAAHDLRHGEPVSDGRGEGRRLGLRAGHEPSVRGRQQTDRARGHGDVPGAQRVRDRRLHGRTGTGYDRPGGRPPRESRVYRVVPCSYYRATDHLTTRGWGSYRYPALLSRVNRTDTDKPLLSRVNRTDTDKPRRKVP